MSVDVGDAFAPLHPRKAWRYMSRPGDQAPRCAWIVATLVALGACTTGVQQGPQAVPDLGAPAVADVEPALSGFEVGMMDHADRFGFSADSREFGYCMTDGGAGATRCGFLDARGTLTALTDFSREAGEPDAAITEALGRRMAGDQAPPGRWRYARDLVLVWQVTGTHEPGEAAPDVRVIPVLRVGARVRTAATAALPIEIAARPDAYTIHAETIVASPDGATIAVLSHDFGGEFSDHFQVRSIAAAALARDAYTAAAREREGAGDAAGARKLFGLAEQAGAAL